ncbi:ABC transporter permease [Ruminiclostridium cellobioparum]|uniref:ABC-type polysaccharide transport system, permease component n=1 Tax=Ruminiclostridium cellobioparum subsp. termitidis CT1112 TaxID=1195236 RepID=S0FLS6_RUMCE|nr:ABC-type polysaccharide transport system, permease component [Ruminiclostridium cellobioparum subsp. termitidis CT1112]
MDTIVKVESNRISSIKRRNMWNAVLRHKVLYLLMLPGIIYMLLNNYIPMFGIIIAFKNYNFEDGFLFSPTVGFDNFRYLFETPDAFIMTRNTLGYNAVFIVVNLVMSVTMAILLNEVRNRYSKRFYQSAVLLPFFLSAVIVAYLVYSLLNPDSGLVNRYILKSFGVEPISWYLEPKYWPFILVITNAWKNVGYGSIIYISAMTGIDTEYYEAATIDGARKWQQVKYITIPLLVPVMVIMTILSIGRIFYSDFGLFYQLPMGSGTLLPVTNVIDTYVYNSLVNMGDIGMSSAAGFYQSVVGFLLVLTTNLVVRKISPENALF